MTPASNFAASIHQKIHNKAVAEHRPFNDLLQFQTHLNKEKRLFQ